MFARHRDFLYKRSQNHGLVARLGPVIPAVDSSANAPGAGAATPTPTAKTPVVPVNPLPSTQTDEDSPTTTSPTLNPSPTSQTTKGAPSESESSTSSSSPTRSSPTSASSVTSHASSLTVSNPLNVAPSTSLYAAPSFTTRATPGASLTLSSGLSPTATPSASSGSSGSTNTGAIIGGIAGTLAGVAILGFLLMWCMRRQRNRDLDDFDARAFKRQSAVLVDDPVEPPRSYNPRPPTMIERHNASPALATQAGYGGQNFYGGYDAYDQQSPYPPEAIPHAGSPPPQAYGAPSMGYSAYNDPQQRIVGQPSDMGHTAYNGQQQFARQPSNAAYLTRQPSSPAGYAPPIAHPVDSNAQYIDLNRSSVSPYQAAQYADISRQLGSTNPNAKVHPHAVEIPADPLPSPFDDPVQATPAPRHVGHSTTTASGPVTTTSVPQTHGNIAQPHQRPATVYDEGDAYGGI